MKDHTDDGSKTVPVGTTAPKPYSDKWLARVGAFAVGVNIDIGLISEALRPIVGPPGTEALSLLEDSAVASDVDIKKAIAQFGIPTALVNKYLPRLRSETADTGPASEVPAVALDILPSLPSDESFIEALKVGGILKVETTDVIAAVKAVLADKVGLYNLTSRILKRMEEFATKQAEPCGKTFFDLQRLLTQRRYGDLFQALGVSGQFINSTRKKEFLGRVNTLLWPSLGSFHARLSEWNQAWIRETANPAFLLLALRNQSNVMPMAMVPPDTSAIRAAAESFMDTLNAIFAGPGIPVCRALAWDVSLIMKVVNDKDLPTQLGSSSKEQMLKDLGVNVGADMVRTEQSLTRYTLAIMKLKEVPVDQELQYLAALVQVGTTIPWKHGVTNNRSGAGSSFVETEDATND